MLRGVARGRSQGDSILEPEQVHGLWGTLGSAAQVEGGVGSNSPVLRLLQEVGQAWVGGDGRGWVSLSPPRCLTHCQAVGGCRLFNPYVPSGLYPQGTSSQYLFPPTSVGPPGHISPSFFSRMPDFSSHFTNEDGRPLRMGRGLSHVSDSLSVRKISYPNHG